MLLLEGPISAHQQVPKRNCSIRHILRVSLRVMKPNHKSIKQYFHLFSIISRKVKTSNNFRKRLNWIDRKQEEEGNVDRSLPKVCGPSVPTPDLLALSNLQWPSAAHGSKQLFLHNNANSWPPSQVWQSRSSLVMWPSPRGTLNLHAHSSSPSDGLVFVQNLFSVIYFSASSNSVLWGCKHRGNYASVTVYD